jgi:putative transposase
LRKSIFVNDEYYHVFNRGVEKRKIFLGKNDYKRFILGMKLLNCEESGNMLKWRDLKKSSKVEPLDFQRFDLRGKLVGIIAYCLNPNHFHLILQQRKEKGISMFMQRVLTAYAMYFNKKNNRSGGLFQGKFKAAHVVSNEYLLYLSAYVNCNNFIHRLNNDPQKWFFSSYLDYAGKRNGNLCDMGIILDQFNNSSKDYENFCKMNAEYLRDKKEFQKMLLE